MSCCNKESKSRSVPEMELLDQLLITGVLKQVSPNTFTSKDFEDRGVTFTIKRIPETWSFKYEVKNGKKKTNKSSKGIKPDPNPIRVARP